MMARSGIIFQAVVLCFVLVYGGGRADAVLTFDDWSIPSPVSSPQGIAAGPDNAIWFTELSGKIGRISLLDYSFNEYAIPTAAGHPLGITTGPDGNIWFAESNSDKIGMITAADKIITEYTVPPYDTGNYDITTGPDGALWFTYYSRIGRITTGGGVTGVDLSLGSQPRGIAAGPDGALWFADYSNGRIGRITTGGIITYYTLPLFATSPLAMTAGPDGALWFTTNATKIGRITTGGVFTIYDYPGAASVINGIAAGPDGAIWFTIGSSNMIGRITTFGSLTEYEISTTAASYPTAITGGPDGAIWFTEGTANKIGRFSFSKWLIKTTVTAIGGSNTVTCNPNPVMESTVSLCSITPDAGYHVIDVYAGNLSGIPPSASVGATGSYYFYNVNEAKDIQAWFDPNDIRLYRVTPPALVQSYPTILEALNDPSLVQPGDWVKVLPGAYVEGTGLTLNRADAVPFSFTLSGGWNSGFTSNAGALSVIAGNLTIEGTGGLIIDQIVIQ